MSSYFFVFLVIANLYGYYSVDCASCTTSSTCQLTDYTLTSCTSNACNCINSSFTAIRTGCALNLDKPVITSETNSNQVINTKTFILTCNLADAETYEWYKDTVKIASATTYQYSATATASADVGSFTCKGTTADTKLTSGSSDAFKVEILGTGFVTSSSVRPTVYVTPADKAITGSSIALACNNIPMGAATTDYSFTVDGSAATSPVTLSSANAGKDVTCTIADKAGSYVFTSGTSLAAKLPTIITNIQSVAVTWNSQTLTAIRKATPTSLTLTCTYTGYVGASPSIEYAWQKDGTAVSGATNQVITVTASSSTSGTYSCTATLSGQTAVASTNKVAVTYDSDSLESSSYQPIAGGRVVLTCGDIRYDGVTYWWYKSTTKIDRQYDRKLQIDNFGDDDTGIYYCKIVLNGFELDSLDSISLTKQTTLAKPSVEVADVCGTLLGEKGDYWLVCSTSSETVGMTYEWTAKGVVSTTVTGKYYSLPAISTSDNGDYTCKAKFGSLTSAASNAKTVAVTPPGLHCNNDNTCPAYSGYSGKCDQNDRCLCSDGYTQKGERCSGGFMTVASSTIIIAMAYLVSRII